MISGHLVTYRVIWDLMFLAKCFLYAIAGEYGNMLSQVADWPHIVLFYGDTCDDLRWSAMLLEA